MDPRPTTEDEPDHEEAPPDLLWALALRHEAWAHRNERQWSTYYFGDTPDEARTWHLKGLRAELDRFNSPSFNLRVRDDVTDQELLDAAEDANRRVHTLQANTRRYGDPDAGWKAVEWVRERKRSLNGRPVPNVRR